MSIYTSNDKVCTIPSSYRYRRPSRGAQRLEGYVIVQFDVTAIGSATNISVLKSSHSVFERNSIRAAERFKYKARIIDGQAVATCGLRNQFTFEMED